MMNSLAHELSLKFWIRNLSRDLRTAWYGKRPVLIRPRFSKFYWSLSGPRFSIFTWSRSVRSQIPKISRSRATIRESLNLPNYKKTTEGRVWSSLLVFCIRSLDKTWITIGKCISEFMSGQISGVPRKKWTSAIVKGFWIKVSWSFNFLADQSDWFSFDFLVVLHILCKFNLKIW